MRVNVRSGNCPIGKHCVFDCPLLVTARVAEKVTGEFHALVRSTFIPIKKWISRAPFAIAEISGAAYCLKA